MTSKDQLVSWLNDAYSMERSLLMVLENHAKDGRDFPEIKTRDEQHLAETRHHADNLERCLAILGEKPSKTKGAIGSVMGKVQGAASGAFRDEIVKNFLSDYAAEHMEIACYESLIVAAEELGYPEIARMCRENLADEEDMAAWLKERIPEVTRLSLQQIAAHS